MSRILLIQLLGGEQDHNFSVYNLAEPLGLQCIEAYLARLGHEVTLLHPRMFREHKNEPNLLETAIEFQPDFVGFSAMTNQVPATAKLAQSIKDSLPGVITVVGGDHFSGYPQDLVNYKMFDFCISGEGELNFQWVVDSRTRFRKSDEIPAGIYMNTEHGMTGSGTSERIPKLDSLPNPTRHGPLLRWSHVGPLMWPPKPHQIGMASIYASRGCPYACAYCDARDVWGKGVAWRDPAMVTDELCTLHQKYGVNTAFFVDLTFNSDRTRVVELCRELGERNPGISWYALLRPGNPNDRIGVDKPLLEALRQAGCVKVGFGLETISTQIGRQLRRLPQNEALRRIVQWCDELGLLSKVFVMIGHPKESTGYYLELEQYLRELGADEVRVSFLTAFPGTPLWRSVHKLIEPNVTYEDFTTFRPVLKHPLFSMSELTQLRLQMLRRYYFSCSYENRISRKGNAHPHLVDSYSEFMSYIASQFDERPEESIRQGIAIN